jgi:hypothetical protein
MPFSLTLVFHLICIHFRCLELLFRATPEDKEQGDLNFQFFLPSGSGSGGSVFSFHVSLSPRLGDLREGDSGHKKR